MAEIAKDKGVDPADIEIWFADEARIGQKNKITRRWARRGTRPSAPHDQRTASTYIFGAICPKDGKGAALVLPTCNTEAMNLHLAEIATEIAPELGRMGFEVEVRPVDQVQDLAAFDAVLLGSSIRFGKWQKEAIAFGESHAAELRRKPVWLFDSGPLFTWPDQGRNEPVRAAEELKLAIDAKSRTTFGGKLERDDASFLMRRVMASGKAGHYGDFRNLPRVRNWAHEVGVELQTHSRLVTA